MCGLFAAIGYPLSESALDNVLKILAHRGPDGHGVYRDEANKVTIAHTRLAVIDLLTGAQPIESEDGQIVLACNGEIYEFEEIRASLEAKGHRFQTKSDSEVILYLYREFGLGLFEHLRGEFAFILYDKARRHILAGRDRFGMKPLYFSRLASGWVFASEMKAIFASGLVVPEFRISALDLLRDQDPENIPFPFENIEHIPPASYALIELDGGAFNCRKYWSHEIPVQTAEPVGEPSERAFGDAAAVVRQELDEAVRVRLRADVPVGLYLSGGLDSCFVGALMKKNTNQPFHSFSISFPGSGADEGEAARKAADFLGTQHHDLAVSRKMLWDHLGACVWFSELPFLTLSPVGLYLLSEQARKHVTVVLNGQGADEVFLGYRKFFMEAVRDTRLGQAAPMDLTARVTGMTPGGLSDWLLRWVSLFLFHKSRRSALVRARAGPKKKEPTSKPLINAVQEARIADMPLRILCYLGDRSEMAHSLEVRLPFLDHKLYEVARSIPVDFKVRNKVEKAVLREAARGVLPDDLRLRKKKGFMHTSAGLDFFGTDRTLTKTVRSYLGKDVFDAARVFSYGTYRVIRLLATIPAWARVSFLKKLHRFANQAILYIVEIHMLHARFIANPPWKGRGETPLPG
ncbi:MAG: asparagine synthase (glutamine-hydrolyzing) [Hyphomicrobiales bacterium]